jgi:serine/threonine-protein kinase HipA
MDDYCLHIFDGQAWVGTLAFDPQAAEFSLAYAPEWVKSAKGYALSPHLPLNGGASSGAIRRFIENLLPEGRALDVASVYSNIQKNNIFALIRYLGKEVAGALSFLPAGQTPQTLAPGKRPVPLEELQERITTRQQVPFSVWDGKVRMSMAGYQDKLLVQLNQG